MKLTKKLTNIYKLTAFALPISAGALVNMIASFIAMMMVAQLGKVQLAAGALAVSTFITLLTVTSTIFYAIAILISHYKGQGRAPAEIGQLVKNGFWLAILLAIPTIAILWNVDKVLLIFKQDPELVQITHLYFHYAALTMIPTLIGAVIAQFYTGTGNPKFMLMLSFMGLPFIILFSYGFVLGNFGLPKLGLAGITCSTFIVQSLVCACVLTYMFFAKNIQKYQIFSGHFLPNLALCKDIFTLGLPIGIQFGAELAAMAVATYFMGYFGVTALAASQIVSQYGMLIIMVILGLSQGLSILVSEAFGNRDLELVKQYINSAMIILCLFFTLVFAVLLLVPETLIKMFISIESANQNVIDLAINLFTILGITLLIDGVRNLLSGGLRGLQDSKAPMRIGVLCLWAISLPVSYLVGFTLNGGPIGLRIGFMSGFIFASVLLWLRIQDKTHLIFSTQPRVLSREN